MTLEEMEKQQKEADAVLGASDADNCSYSKGLNSNAFKIIGSWQYSL